MMMQGIRVLELGRVPPAEVPGMMLADLGADVIKIDTPAAPVAEGGEAHREAVFTPTNRNKRSIALDLKSEAGRSAFLTLARTADVIIEGFRPGVVTRLGVDYAAVSAINPRIVYCSMSSYGQDGPDRTRSAHDLNFLGVSGALALIGEADRKPAIPMNLVADLGGASMHSAFAIATALFARTRTNRGQYIDVSYLDCTMALLANTPSMRTMFSAGVVAGRGAGVTSGAYPYYAVYADHTGALLTLACSEPALWEKFCTLVGRPDLRRFARCKEHYTRAPTAEEAAARDAVQAMLATKSRDEWCDTLGPAGVAIARVNSVFDALSEPQVEHREMIAHVEHPVFGAVHYYAPAPKYSAYPSSIRRVAPYPGEHTAEILQEAGVQVRACARPEGADVGVGQDAV